MGQASTQTASDHILCGGVRIPNDPDVVTGKIARKLRTETYEASEISGLAKFVRRGDRVLELGSGIGFVSSYLATQMKIAQITCVEANQALCDFTRKVHAANGITSADVRNAVVCTDAQARAGDGTLPFYVTSPFWSSSLTKPSKGDYETVDVPLVSLAGLVAETKPTVIVADVEGSEAAIFEDTDLSGVNFVFMELHTRYYGGRGVMQVFDHMQKNGFFYHQRVSSGGAVLFKRL